MAYRIVNARIVNEGTIIEGDLVVADGRILGVNIGAPVGAVVVDAGGAYLV
ncbi:MAG TPA: dihydroorotase, partial [Acidobacteria bacterium]|nr:dihydroorotase [Acidobacteriota bacterium]